MGKKRPCKIRTGKRGAKYIIERIKGGGTRKTYLSQLSKKMLKKVRGK